MHSLHIVKHRQLTFCAQFGKPTRTKKCIESGYGHWWKVDELRGTGVCRIGLPIQFHFVRRKTLTEPLTGPIWQISRLKNNIFVRSTLTCLNSMPPPPQTRDFDTGTSRLMIHARDNPPVRALPTVNSSIGHSD
jgi:hypothetical protein